MTDFGIDNAFGCVPNKLKEHYGIDMPVSTIQKTTEHHAQRCYEAESALPMPKKRLNGGILIGEMDGSMVPVVEISQTAKDKRREKKLIWKEVRLCLAHKKGEVTPKFGGNFSGGVEESGKQFERCAIKAGFGIRSHLHAVGDGAQWIADQVDIHFGKNSSYLVDFYHMCEYLSAASKVCEPNDTKTWMEEQKQRLKTNKTNELLAVLKPFLEDGDEGPVIACYRYINNRLSQLDYEGALKSDLPIGSGEIESAHRYIIQERLKLPGAWWKSNNIEAMLALRITRANQEWEALWPNTSKQSA